MRKKKVEVVESKNGEYMSRRSRAKQWRWMASLSIAASWLFPVAASAETEEVSKTFENVHTAVLNAVDSGVVLVIIFAGASWMMGHRSRAIEILIGVACGYLIISHAMNLRDFLKSI